MWTSMIEKIRQGKRLKCVGLTEKPYKAIWWTAFALAVGACGSGNGLLCIVLGIIAFAILLFLSVFVEQIYPEEGS